MTEPQHASGSMRGAWLLIAGALTLAVPGIVLRLSHFSHDPVIEASLFGLAILGGAILLGSGAELAEQEVSRSLAVAVLALVAVLPEYAVDMVFAWKAADDPAFAHYAAANMTGANRMLIGIGWAAVILIFWYRQARRPVKLDKSQSLEVVFLLLATAWAFTIYLRSLFRDGSLNLVDTGVLVMLFIIYIALSSRGKAGEHGPVVGPMAPLGRLSKTARWTIVAGLFAAPALIILATAEPFAEGLVETGKHLGIDEFLLVQWIAPLASEAPEMAIAIYFAFRGMGTLAMGVLISSKVNQWTLLVGTLPLVYTISLGSAGELPMDSRQVDEFLLTSSQSLFAVLLILTLRVSWRGGLALFVLFVSQFFFTDETERIIFSLVYLGLCVALLGLSREHRDAALGIAKQPLRALRLGGAVARPGGG